MNVKSRILATIAAGAVALSTAATPALAAGSAQSMHRLYNPYSGEHFYTASVVERDHLVGVGWSYEGIGWVAPAEGDPVYRLYNPYSGDHHYTTSAQERDHLVGVGWRDEGVGWMSGGEVAVLRQYNPYASTATHNYTISKRENDHLVSVGWNYEGVGWWALLPEEDDGHEHSWATRTVVDQAAWDEPTYEEQPVYEERSVYVVADGFRTTDYQEKYEHVKELIKAGVRGINETNSWVEYETVQVGTKKVQTGTVHHDAVTHEERYCSLCGAVA